MSGAPPPTRSQPTISTANPPVLIDFVSHVPAPVTRLLVEQAGTIKALRRAAEIASWKSPKVSESWILLAVWWFICASAYFGVRRAIVVAIFGFLVPLVVISPAVWRYLKVQSWWPWREVHTPHEPVAASDVTVAATISDITSLRLLLPPFIFGSTPVRSPILDALRLSSNALPLKSLLRATAILYIPYLLATFLIPLPVIFGLVGTVILTIRAPWIVVLRSHVSENGWARWIWRRVWAFLTGQPVIIPGSAFTLQSSPTSMTGIGRSGVVPKVVKKNTSASTLKPVNLRFRFDILENQRWWVGIDWSSALLPNERTSWCSPAPHLAPLSPPITFTLPGPSTHIDKTLKIRRRAFWRWDDPEWTVLVKTSHEGHLSRMHVALPDVSSDSESRLAKGLKMVGDNLPESAAGSVRRRSVENAGDDESHEAPPSPSAMLKDPLTDSDGWVYADNKWEGPSPKGGIGKYTRYRIWSRCAVLIEEIEDLDNEELAKATETPKSPAEIIPPVHHNHRHHHQKGHEPAASEDLSTSGVSSSVNERESRLTSRLKSEISRLYLVMTSASHAKWGPLLKEYLDRPEARLTFPDLVGEVEINAAIDAVLNNPTTVTYKALENFMGVLYRPVLLKRLINKRSTRSCMQILRTYASRNGSTQSSLFEHAFGFLGIHVLSLVLQAGLLDSFPRGLDGFPRILASNSKCAWDIRAPALHDRYSQMFLNYFTSGLGFDYMPSPSNWTIEWCEGTRGDERACLPSIGGFAYRDAGFILDQLFEHRDAFLECGFRTGTPGWSILLLVLQFLLDDRWLMKPGIPEIWKRQYQVTFRYSLISGARADSFMELLCGRFTLQYAQNTQQFANHAAPIGQSDADLVSRAYARKFRPNQAGTHNTIDLSYLICITDYTRDAVAGRLPLEMSLAEMTLEITWDVLKCVGKAGDERWEVMDVFMGKNLHWQAKMLTRKNQPEIVTGTIMLLYKWDIVNMLGRYLLIPPYLRTNKPYVLMSTNFTITSQAIAAIQAISAAVKKALDRENSLKLLMNGCYPDW
ncbi:hypothetical protein FRC07_006663, partial [Ceratobasidium sp. 392]